MRKIEDLLAGAIIGAADALLLIVALAVVGAVFDIIRRAS